MHCGRRWRPFRVFYLDKSCELDSPEKYLQRKQLAVDDVSVCFGRLQALLSPCWPCSRVKRIRDLSMEMSFETLYNSTGLNEFLDLSEFKENMTYAVSSRTKAISNKIFLRTPTVCERNLENNIIDIYCCSKAIWG